MPGNIKNKVRLVRDGLTKLNNYPIGKAALTV